jgi:hypothetical protein
MALERPQISSRIAMGLETKDDYAGDGQEQLASLD